MSGAQTDHPADVSGRPRADSVAAPADRVHVARERLRARMSHELRTPLHAVLGVSRLLEEADDAAVRDHGVQITTAATHLLGLVDDLLDLAQLDAGRLPVDAVRVDAGAVVGDVVALMRPLADEHGVVLTASVGADGPVWTRADPRRVRQVLLNLVGNALKYAACGRRCEINVREVRDRVEIDVADRGPGIAREHRARLFEPFDRLGRDGGAPGGAGLGLTLSRALTEAMGGRIAVAAGPDRGTTFTVALPGDPGPGTGAAAATPTAEPQPRSRSHLRVLVAEDHDVHRAIAVRLLRAAGHEVRAVPDGRAALQLLGRERFDLAVLDEEMPGPGGRDVARRLRALGHRVPVVLVSSHADGALTAVAGVDRVIVKPLTRSDVARFTELATRPSVVAAAPRGAAHEARRVPSAAMSMDTERPARFAVRTADADDAAACARIYEPYVRDSVATFEETPPDAETMARRMAASHAWIVATEGDVVVGYAYGAAHQARAAYRWSADVAVYVADSHLGQGIGRTLYDALVPELRDRGLRTLCAAVTQPNPPSEALHRACGFTDVGVFERIGFKHGRWLGVRWFQLDLRPGDDSPPADL